MKPVKLQGGSIGAAYGTGAQIPRRSRQSLSDGAKIPHDRLTPL